MPRGTHALTPEFNEETATIRSVDYRLRELSIGDYDDLVKKATQEDTNVITGEKTESIDNTLLLKMMVIKCSVDPKLTDEKLAGMPMRVVLKLNQTVNRMHYGDEPDSEVKKAVDGEEEESEGNA